MNWKRISKGVYESDSGTAWRNDRGWWSYKTTGGTHTYHRCQTLEVAKSMCESYRRSERCDSGDYPTTRELLNEFLARPHYSYSQEYRAIADAAVQHCSKMPDPPLELAEPLRKWWRYAR